MLEQVRNNDEVRSRQHGGARKALAGWRRGGQVAKFKHGYQDDMQNMRGARGTLITGPADSADLSVPACLLSDALC